MGVVPGEAHLLFESPPVGGGQGFVLLGWKTLTWRGILIWRGWGFRLWVVLTLGCHDYDYSLSESEKERI
jgi:hypothetical protein